MSRTFNSHPAGRLLAGMISHRPQPVMDSAGESAGDGETYVATNVALSVAGVLQEWAETDNLDEGEGYGDRLMAMLVGIADDNQNGELDDDEIAIFTSACEFAWDYLSGKGVTDDDCDKLLNDFDNDVADRVHELLIQRLPDGEDASGADIDAFAFGDEGTVAMDAVYKKAIAIRNGKKTRINKRISGTVRLSAKQKLSIRKAGMKAHSAKAQMRRAKSMRIRNQAMGG